MRSGWVLWLLVCSGSAHAGVAFFPGQMKGDAFVATEGAEAPAVRFATVNAEVDAQRAHCTFEERVSGAGAAVGVLPLPPGADADSVAVWIDGKPAPDLGGVFLPADAAREIYAALAKGTQSSVPLAWTGRPAYLLPAVELGPRTVVRAALRIAVEQTDDLRVVTLPMPQGHLSARPVQRTRVTVDLKAHKPLRAITSPTHDLVVRRDGPRAARAAATLEGLADGGDLQLFFVEDDDALGLRLLSHRVEGDAAGYFMLLGFPSGDADAPPPPKDIVLAVDTSGSMRGEKMEQARAAVSYVLDHLGPEDRFDLITFGTDVSRLDAKLVPADAAGVARGQAFLDAAVAHGRTNIAEALATSLAGQPSDRPRIVIFLTDGAPTAGEMRPEAIIEQIPTLNTSRARVFVMGVGHDVHTHLLDRIAADTGGTTTYVDPSEAIDVKLAALYDGLSHPVLADIALAFSGVQVDRVEPAELPTLFRGQELMVLGRYTGGGPATVTLRGTLGGVERTHSVTAELPKDARAEHGFVAALWAGRRLGALLRKVRLHGEDEASVAEIVQLSRDFGIVTEYTRFLADEALDGAEAATRARTLMREANLQTSGVWAVSQANNEAHLMKKRVASGMDNSYVDRRGERRQATRTKTVGRRTFYQRDGKWVQAGDDGPKPAKKRRVKRFSPAYFRMVEENPDVAKAQQLDGEMEMTVDDTRVEFY